MFHTINNILRRRGLLTIISFAFSFSYASVYFLGAGNYRYVVSFMYGYWGKPFVYRQLVPPLARALELVGVRLDLAVTLIVAAFGVAFVLSMIYFLQTFGMEKHTESIAFLSLVVFAFMFHAHRSYYDFSTAFFFTWLMALMVREKFKTYLLVFPFACINRETTGILIVLFALYFKNKMERRAYWTFLFGQSVVYMITQTAIRYIFRDAGGNYFFIPWQNISSHLSDIPQTLLGMSVLGVILWSIYRDWGYKPPFLRLAFSIFAPTFAVLYVIVGNAFEYRVFAEMFSVSILLARMRREAFAST